MNFFVCNLILPDSFQEYLQLFFFHPLDKIGPFIQPQSVCLLYNQLLFYYRVIVLSSNDKYFLERLNYLTLLGRLSEVEKKYYILIVLLFFPGN